MDLNHVNENGEARMVDVGAKKESRREAVAGASVEMKPETLARIRHDQIAKGDVLATARIAGIMAAKKTDALIPLCHPLRLTGIQVDLTLRQEPPGVDIEARVTTTDKTGVEMEALTAAATAALTIYDMCKAVEKGMTVTNIRLLQKRGGKSGEYRAE